MYQPRRGRFEYAHEAIENIEDNSCSLGCVQGIVNGKIDPEMPGGHCDHLIQIILMSPVSAIDEHDGELYCKVREPLEQANTDPLF